jgi:NADH:ubiquinone oxidoreductase subunit 5 (subunit L)/multisubunit Na+/H+ antiporter MnhA subunit
MRKKKVIALLGVLLLFGILIVSLTGLPPFPGFWAKYRFIMNLGSQGSWVWAGLILLGSLLEIVYFFRWFGEVAKGEYEGTVKSEFALTLPPFAAAFGLSAAGIIMAAHAGISSVYFLLPVAGALILFALDWLPASVKGILTIAGISLYTWHILPGLSGVNYLFAVVFLIGGIVELIATIRKGPSRTGFFPLLAMMILSLGNLLVSKTLLEVFHPVSSALFLW